MTTLFISLFFLSLLSQNIRDGSSLDPKVIVSMFKRDVAFALRRGTAQQFRVVTDAAMEAAQRNCLPIIYSLFLANTTSSHPNT